MKKNAAALVISLALLLAACTPPATPAPTQPPVATNPPVSEPTEVPVVEPTDYPADEISIGFGGTIPLSHPGIFVPQVMGFYAEENLTVNIQPNDGSGQSLQLLGVGELDFAQVAPESAVIARSQGIPVVTIFTVNAFSSRLCSLADSDIASVADLQGTRIGVPSATSSQIPFVKAMLTSAGLNPETDAELVPTGFGAAAAEALTRGDVAAIGYWGGYYIETEELGFAYKCFDLPGMETAPGHVIVTLEETVQNRPDLVERLGRAYAKGVLYANTHAEGTVRAYWSAYPDAKATDVDEATLLASNSNVVDKSLDDFFWDYAGWQLGMSDPAGWTALIDYMVDSAQLTEAIPAEDIINNDFVAQFNDFDAAAITALPDPQP